MKLIFSNAIHNNNDDNNNNLLKIIPKGAREMAQ